MPSFSFFFPFFSFASATTPIWFRVVIFGRRRRVIRCSPPLLPVQTRISANIKPQKIFLNKKIGWKRKREDVFKTLPQTQKLFVPNIFFHAYPPDGELDKFPVFYFSLGGLSILFLRLKRKRPMTP